MNTKRAMKTFSVFLLLTAMVLLFQNCADQSLIPHQVITVKSSSTAASPAPIAPPVVPPVVVDPPPPVAELDCTLAYVRCVSATAGAKQEYATIQAAANIVQAGDVVQVYAGTYAGFRIARSGSSSAPIVFKAIGSVLINSPSSTGNGIHISNSNYITIEGFEISNTTDKCIGAREASATAPMRGLVIRKNRCVSSGHEGFYLSQVSSSLIEENEIFNTGVTDSYRSHGIYLANAGADNTIISGNIIHDILGSDSAGIHMNGDVSVGGDGIISGLTIENNILYNIATHNAFNMDGVQNSTIRFNLVYNTGRHILRAYGPSGGGDGAEGPKNLIIYNNTFVTGAGGNPIKLTDDAGGGNKIFNNILLSTAGMASISVENQASIQTSSNTVMPTSLNSVFVNASVNNYTPKAGGPADNAGVANFSGVTAFTGSGPFDVGALQN